MKKQMVALAATLSLLTAQSWAQISVGPGLSAGPFSFDTAPAVADGWTTGELAGNGATYSGATAFANLDAAVKAIASSSVAAALGTTAGTGQNRAAQWDSNGLRIYTRSTTIAATLLMATLRNDSGGAISSVTINYTLAGNTASEDPGTAGHIVYYSTTGAAGSWTQVAELSGDTLGAKSATITLNWAAGASLYILWVDDNGNGATDGYYAIDDISFTGGTASVPLSVTLTAPADGAKFLSPADVTVTASTVGTVPATSVTIYTNNAVFTTLTTAPYTTTIPALPPGVYTIYARAVNASESATSSSHTITVREAYLHYTGGTITETFDSMGATGTETPIGWYIGTSATNITMTVGVDDGSQPVSAGTLWNYGTASATDRALGTSPTGGERNMLVRIKNDTGNSITAINFTYDGETWRNYTNNVAGNLTNYVSVDSGATWVATGFNYTSAAFDPQGPVNGDDPANRTAGIGGAFTLPTPLNPGNVLLIRWHDFNDNGITDGGLAIDNFSFSATTATVPLTVSLTGPANGTMLAPPATVTLTATASGTTPATSVAFYTNGVFFTSVSAAPFTATLNSLPPGTYRIHAQAVNGVDPTAISATNTITVLGRLSFTGAALTETFDGMGVDGTLTPVGWFAGWVNPTNHAIGVRTNLVAISDGSTISGNAGFNVGVSNETERALGVHATGTGVPSGYPSSRFLEAQIQNNSAQPIQSFTITFDGEQWRSGTTVTNYVLATEYSVDGTNFTDLNLVFYPPETNTTAAAAMNGNDPANRVSGLTTSLTLPVAVPPGGVLYLRWFDLNDAGTDPLLAIDNFSFSTGVVETKPTLTAQRVGGNLVITWPDSFTGYQLKETPTLSPPNWQNSTHAPVQGGGVFTVTIPATGRSGFFELSK